MGEGHGRVNKKKVEWYISENITLQPVISRTNLKWIKLKRIQSTNEVTIKLKTFYYKIIFSYSRVTQCYLYSPIDDLM